VFVTLRESNGQLRGCIGRTHPSEPSLAQEVATAAQSAATSDPRFPPVTRDELGGLSFEVSVLEAPEPAAHLSDLDPDRYGVVVNAEARRGVLLPNVDGVNSAVEQVRIARHKAGIAEGDSVRLERFRVHKVSGMVP
jgi:AmmeMemoRadiSam system protein A